MAKKADSKMLIPYYADMTEEGSNRKELEPEVVYTFVLLRLGFGTLEDIREYVPIGLYEDDRYLSVLRKLHEKPK